MEEITNNAPECVVCTLNLTNIPTEPKLPQTGDNMNLFFYMGIGALALITGLGAGLSRRKKCEWKYFFKRFEIALDHTLLNRVWYK